MNMAAYNPFGGMTSGDQSFGARRPFLLDGDYNVEIERCLIKGRSEPWFVIEVTVLESNVPERPAGAQCSIFIDANNQDTRGKHICAFITSAMGYDPMTLPKDSQVAPWDGQPWGGYAAWAISEQNPFGKKRMFVNVQSIFTQARSAFSLHTFGPYGQKPIGPRILGPAYGQGGQQAPAPGGPGAPAGSAPGFQQPAPQPGVAPPGFVAPMPPQGGGQPPLGGFAPPPGAQAPSGPPPAGWGQQPSFPAAPQQGSHPQLPQPQPQPQQPQAPQTGYQQPPQQQYPQQPQQPPQQYPQQPQQPPQGQYPQPGFGGPWGGQQR